MLYYCNGLVWQQILCNQVPFGGVTTSRFFSTKHEEWYCTVHVYLGEIVPVQGIASNFLSFCF